MRTVRTPQAGRWRLEPSATTVAFSGRATRFSPTVQARFPEVAGFVLADDAPGGAVVDVRIGVGSMTSGNRGWDELVATVDPFQAARFPTARYRSTSVQWHGTEAVIDGVLALRGVQRPVRLQARHEVAPCGTRLTLAATGEIDREQFGVRCDIPGAALLVPRRLRLTVDAVLVHEGALVAA
jgi:polyisoprenoid-binding protein YceI